MPEEYKYEGFGETDDTKIDSSTIGMTRPFFSLDQKTGFLPSQFTRLFFYLLFCTLIIELCVMLSLKGYSELLLKEDRLVEWFQVCTLVATSIFIYRASKKYSTMTDAFHVLMILPLIATARELDRLFEHLIAEVTWRILVVMLTLYLISYFWKRFHIITKQFQKFMRTNSFGFMFSGFF